MSYLGLPPIPPDLKSIAPYLQRAHETRSQDPIISYWCAYSAAQAGISLKAVSASNRAFLAALLTTLENLRASVGSSDAITVESASSAYVENFALKVFASADDEDRRGVATRKTAKKFLAAATFFDILTVFEDRAAWEAHVEKTRYAKWRAAEISKALREGRQPTPASASAEPEPAETALDPVSAPPEPFAGLIDAPAPSVHFSHELEEPHSTSALPLVSTSFGGEDTPLEIPPASAPAPINASDVQAQHTALSVSPSPPSSASMPLSYQVDAKAPTEAALPSTAPYDSPADTVQGQGQGQDYLTSIDVVSMTQSPTLAQHPSFPTHLVPQDSPPTAPYLAGGPYASAPPLPPPPSAPYMQIPRQPLPPPPPPPPPETSPPPELTPGLIAKTQKHCRFAISALDYEDVEQARKELRAALAILGG